jgi:hypothetical protein
VSAASEERLSACCFANRPQPAGGRERASTAPRAAQHWKVLATVLAAVQAKVQTRSGGACGGEAAKRAAVAGGAAETQRAVRPAVCWPQESWRRQRGIDSRVRRKFKGCGVIMPNIGYGSNKKTRHLLPSGAPLLSTSLSAARAQAAADESKLLDSPSGQLRAATARRRHSSRQAAKLPGRRSC